MRLVRTVVASAALGLVAPTAAMAGSVAEVSAGANGPYLFVHEDAPTANVIAMGYDAVADQFVVVDQTGIVAQSPCFSVNAATVRCPRDTGGATIDSILVAGQTLDDEILACCTIPPGVRLALIGGQADDLMHGSKGGNYMSGGSGDDQLFGEAGADRIVGGMGADSLYGMAGVDFLQARDLMADRVINCGVGPDRRPAYDPIIDPPPVRC